MYAENEPVTKTNEVVIKGLLRGPYKIEANGKIQVILNTQQHCFNPLRI